MAETIILLGVEQLNGHFISVGKKRKLWISGQEYKRFYSSGFSGRRIFVVYRLTSNAESNEKKSRSTKSLF
jgi:hypothetical protein